MHTDGEMFLFLHLLLCVIIGTVTSHNCLGLTSCDCRREGAWLTGEQHRYHVIDCEGYIDLKQMNFSSIRNNEELQNITFSNTTLKTFSSIFLNGLNVHALTIAHQKLKLDTDSFKTISESLKHLSLIDVNISKTWKMDFLKPLSKLENLVLDENGNYMEDFPNQVFRNVSSDSLQHLSLRSCKIVRLSHFAFDGLSNLETLDLSHNFLPTVPDAILLLRNLRKLNLSFNERLNYVHNNAFQGLTKLEEIDLSHTDLSIIFEKAFSGLDNSLKVLNLHHANLQDGHFYTMKDLKRLKAIDISYNKIIEMHNTSFEGFASLEELDISGQSHIEKGKRYSLGFIDSVFKGIERKLKILRIRDLGLVSLPLAAIGSLTNLKILDVSENDFEEIYEDFFYGVRVDEIVLTDMEITNVSSAAFDGLPLGMIFYFDRNNITNITFVLETRICQFRKLSLEGNPIQCGCDVVKIAATNRVPLLDGTCADTFYKGENVQTIHTLHITNTFCDTKGFKNITHCSSLYANIACRTVLSTSYFVFSVVVMFYYFSADKLLLPICI